MMINDSAFSHGIVRLYIDLENVALIVGDRLLTTDCHYSRVAP